MAKSDDVQKNSIVITNSQNANVVPYVFSLDRVEKANCNICQCDHRDEAEEMYENQKRKNYSEIKRRLKNDYDHDATINGIKNHMLYHYKSMQNNASMQEYVDDVQRWVNMQTNKAASLKSRIGVLERQVFIISQESEDVELFEKRKSAETVKKLIETIILLEDKLYECQEEAKPVSLVFNQLKVIVNDELAHTDSSKTKKVVSTILSRLHESVGDMMVE